MPSDPQRLQQAMAHVQQMKARNYPAIVGDYGQSRIVDRSWSDLPEGGKLAILRDVVDWSGVTNRDQAHIFLTELDPGKLPDAERNRLIDAAHDHVPLGDFLADKAPPEMRGEQVHDYGMEM